MRFIRRRGCISVSYSKSHIDLQEGELSYLIVLIKQNIRDIFAFVYSYKKCVVGYRRVVFVACNLFCDLPLSFFKKQKNTKNKYNFYE